MLDNTPNLDGSNARIYELENQIRMYEEFGIRDPFCFSSRRLIQATFPHSHRVGNEIKLVNGNMDVTMYSRKGLPYGHYPRLIMCWLTREALRRNATMHIDEARRIPLGSSLNRFLEEIGIIRGMYATAKENSSSEQKQSAEYNPKKRASGATYAALRKQMEKLFSTTISVDFVTTRPGISGTGWNSVQISEEGYLWWENDESVVTPDSYVVLSAKFFRELVDGAVPLNPVHIAQLSRSPMAIDLYSWATYRIATHKGFTRVTWEQLKGQIGTGYPNTVEGRNHFRKNARIALKRVKEAWPEAGISDWGDGLDLRGKEPAVPKELQDPYLNSNAE